MKIYAISEADSVTTVARNLLGKVIFHRLANQEIRGRICQTEAYGADDPTSHSFRGSTKRNAPMFGPAGYSYVYLIYGMYYCLNVTCGPIGRGEAVLIRAVVPITQTSEWPNGGVIEGPGRVGRYFKLTTDDSGCDLSDGKLRLFVDSIHLIKYTRAARIGLSHPVAARQPDRFIAQKFSDDGLSKATGSATVAA